MSLTSYRTAPPRVTDDAWVAGAIGLRKAERPALDAKQVSDVVNGFFTGKLRFSAHRLQCLATTYSSIA
jgi:hypothetical protein